MSIFYIVVGYRLCIQHSYVFCMITLNPQKYVDIIELIYIPIGFSFHGFSMIFTTPPTPPSSPTSTNRLSPPCPPTYPSSPILPSQYPEDIILPLVPLPPLVTPLPLVHPRLLVKLVKLQD